MSRIKRYLGIIVLIISILILTQCKVIREVPKVTVPDMKGIAGMIERCTASDTIRNILISKSEAELIYQGDRYDVTLTLFTRKDSVMFITAVNSGFEIIRGRADKDSIRVIDRLNRVVYRLALNKKFGYQLPVTFNDLENLVSEFYLCNDLEAADETGAGNILFEFDEQWIRKRILVTNHGSEMEKFEFFHDITGQYLMGERTENGNRIYSNFMIGEFEINAGKGLKTYNSDLEIDMEVKPGRYTFIDL